MEGSAVNKGTERGIVEGREGEIKKETKETEKKGHKEEIKRKKGMKEGMKVTVAR